MTRTDIIQLEARANTMHTTAESIRKQLANEARNDGLETTDVAAGLAAKLVDAAADLASYLRDIRENK